MDETILLVDDEKELLAVLSETLKNEGYKVETAKDGIDAMEQFYRIKPSLVITDVKMPRKNGLELLKDIKSSTMSVEVIVLTGYSDEITAIDCLHNGAYDYLCKPLEDIEILLTTVERALEKRTLKKKNQELMLLLKKATIKDPLTDLYNFRHMHTCLENEIIRSGRYRYPFTIFILTIDHFNELNNTMGSLFADFVLKKFSELLKKELRGADSIYRYGKDEFVIILPETVLKDTQIAAERLLSAVRDHQFECDGYQAHVSISIGGACYPEQARDKTKLLKLANQSLDKAKEKGRDRFFLKQPNKYYQ